jgi:hypothetical protein
MLCAYLSAALLAGLLGNAMLGAWWLDKAAALVIARGRAQGGSRELVRRGLPRAAGRGPRWVRLRR